MTSVDSSTNSPNFDNDRDKFITMLDYVFHWAKVIPDKEAFVFRGSDGSRYSLTWAKYAHLGVRFAARLQGMGVSKGDVICNFLMNSPERAVTDLGTMLAGAVPMHGEPLLADGADILETLNKAKAWAVILDPDHFLGDVHVLDGNNKNNNNNKDNKSSQPEGQRKKILCKRGTDGSSLLLQDIEKSADEWKSVPLQLDDFAYVFTTSGSTGFSKLAAYTYGGIKATVGVVAPVGPSTERHFNDLSMGWTAGSTYWLFYSGATRVTIDFLAGMPADAARLFWESVVQENCNTALMMTWTIHSIYRRPELWKNCGHQLTSLYTGGQPTTKGTLAAIGTLTNIIATGYGSTEAGGVAIIIYKHVDEFEEYLTGTPKVKVAIVDENLSEVPTGSEGEILVPGRFWGYLGDPELTKKSFTKDGLFRTNDLGYLDDRGRLFVLGRRSDTIMRGPDIVYPSWLEARIRLCPGVADVIVVPVPDPVLYHEICACVIKKDESAITASDLDQYCKNLFVTGMDESEKLNPKYFLFFTEFPVNKNGKKDRKRLAKMAKKMILSGNGHS